MALNFDLIQKNHTTSAVLSNIEEKSHANFDYSLQVARYILLDIIGLETIVTEYILIFFLLNSNIIQFGFCHLNSQKKSIPTELKLSYVSAK